MGQYGTAWALTLASPQEAGVQLLTHHVIITPTHTSPGDTGEALLDAECSAVQCYDNLHDVQNICFKRYQYHLF